MSDNKLGVPNTRSSGNATGSGRTKVALPKGKSLMDWIRLGDSGVDLTGVGGKLTRVSVEELKKHNTKDDCWMAIGGMVYNISRYCEFHPGGIDEILKGAGKDGTQLFNEVHRWVNYESMLRKCLVGKLVVENVFLQPPKYGSLLAPPKAMASTLSTVNTPQKDSSELPFTNNLVDKEKPRYDFFQNDSAVKVCIYTRTPGITEENLVLERPNGNIKITVYLFSDKIFRIHLIPAYTLLYDCKISSASAIGKLEIDFPKAEHRIKWQRLGSNLDGHNTLTNNSTDDEIQCVVSEVTQVTPDVKLFKLSLPEGYHMAVPMGHHIRIKSVIQDIEVARSYTPVVYLNNEEAQGGTELFFLIKIYEDGALTPSLNRLNPGDSLAISHRVGNFKATLMEPFSKVLLLAAGSGFTPMVKLIKSCKLSEKKCTLAFFNKTEQDIIWRPILDAAQDSNFSTVHILSNPDSNWKGLTGRINGEILTSFLSDEDIASTFIAVCGPIPFNESCERLLKDRAVSERQLHIFQG